MALKPPPSWSDELARALEPEAFAAAPSAPITLRLSFFEAKRDRLAEQGIHFSQVDADFRLGVTGGWKRGGASPFYRLCGSRFDVDLRQKLEDNTRTPIAIVTSVRPASRLARREGVVSAAVSFHPPWDAERCDLDTVDRLLGEQRERAWLRSQAAKRAKRALADSRSAQHDHEQLHGDLRRHYSALQLLLGLLRTRGEVEGTATAAGVVVAPDAAGDPPGDGLLCVQVSRRRGEFDEGATIEVSVAERDAGWRLPLVRADDDRFWIEPPMGVDLVAGSHVSLAYVPRFALQRNERALKQFLEERVEGEWAALARLLSDPGSLPAPGLVPALAPFDGALNAEQRRAVDGAVAAPHAFFIQGPPGTGKTTVITETIRQLVGRGERVLLLAPMHVAVDEVLRRVGDADGVLALRLSWNDSKVRESLRRFLPANVTSEFVRSARRPHTSRATVWREQIAGLAAQRDVLERTIAARSAHAAAASDCARAGADARAHESERDERRRALDAALVAAQRELDAAQAQLVDARRSAREAADELAAAEAGRRLRDRFVGLFGAGTVGRLRRAAKDAEMRTTVAERRAVSLADDVSAASAAVHAHARDGAARAQELAGRRAAAERGVGATSDVLRSVHAELRATLDGSDPALPDDAGLARMTADGQHRRHRLEQYIRLELRWFELAGMTAANGGGVVENLGREILQAANLVCCTTSGFGGDPLVRDTDFDTLIVDEASRVVDSEFLIGANRARRWILVGDEHQLPPYVDQVDEHHLHALAGLHMVDRGVASSTEAAVARLGEIWHEDEELHRFRTESVERCARRLRAGDLWRTQYRTDFAEAYERLRQLGDDAERKLLSTMREHLVRSLFERCVDRCPPSLRVRLIEQRRMIDPIARLVREPVYAGRYRSPSERALRETGVRPLVGDMFSAPVVFCDTSLQPNCGDEMRGTGFVNALEVAWIARACRLLEAELGRRADEPEVTVSVLTFYRAQARELRRALGYPGCRDFRKLRFQVVDAIDRIQGQESDLVLLSFCRTHRARPGRGFALWLQDPRRLNVACTRARRAIVLVGHRPTLEQLRGVDKAQAFYRNLFEVIDGGDSTLMLTDLR